MFTSEDFDLITTMAESIKEIYFKKIPDVFLLNGLSEGSNDIIFHFPANESCGLSEYSEYGFSSKIWAINLETDMFIDHEELYQFSNLRKLTISCQNKNASTISTDDLMKMQIAIDNLIYLEELIIDLRGMRRNLVEEVKDCVFFPFTKMTIKYID